MTSTQAKSVKCVWETRAILGESPLFDPRKDQLYWLDIKGERLFALSILSGDKQEWPLSGNISTLGLHAAGGLIAAGRQGFCHITFGKDAKLSIEYLSNPESEIVTNRFNDGNVDPFGCFWAGTMDNAERDVSAGNWWRYTPSGKVEKMASGFHVTNGPVFDKDRKTAYLTDSARQTIYHATYPDTENFGELTQFKKFQKGEGYPDGMAIDVEGCLWVAFWDGGCLRRLSPKGDILETVKMPVQRPTCPVIIKDRIYVTSASIGLNEDDVQNTLAGSLFEVSLESEKGGPTYYFAQDT